MRFFYYCFYRICRAYKSKDKDFQIYAQNAVSMCQAFNIISIIFIVGCFKGFRPTTTPLIAILLSIAIINLFILNRKKYYELDERWKNEPRQKLKGWLVLSYVLGSVALLFISIFLDKMI